MFELTNIITLMKRDLVWLKLGMRHTARPGRAQLNPNQMTSHFVTATIVQYNTVLAPAGLCPNQFGLLFLPAPPPSRGSALHIVNKQFINKQLTFFFMEYQFLRLTLTMTSLPH